MNRNKKGSTAPKAVLSNKMLQRVATLERQLQKRRGASSGGFDLNNQPSKSSGLIGLSSSNSSRVHKSHTIEEDEYIADISGSVGFATTAYPINPAQSSTFPWGNKIAALYEKYDYQYLEFYYRREVSEYATNGQAGKVMLSADYDAADSAPTTKQQVLDTEPHVDGMPCIEQLVLRLSPKEMRKQDSKFCRPGALPANTDIKTYDSGNLYVSTYGNTNTTVIGELRVRYKCIVSVPVLESSGLGPSASGSYFQITSNLLGEAAAATTVYLPLFASATTPVVLANGIGATLASTGLITVPAGSYLIESSLTASDSAASITASHLSISQVITPNTSLVAVGGQAGFGVVSGIAAASSYNDWFSCTGPVVWNTAQFGTTICLQCADTYASGSAINQAYMKITLL